ncbi:MAG: ABC transporter ATP-binding protein [Vicinamibacterales bacterium]|nr:ABC transporter ATP-binding protein [Vicinamibacterales bacterium]
MISVTSLSKKYGRFVAVDNLSFEVQEGEVLGFLGPNGAGKTTTMRMITGYLPPSHGRVKIGGNDLYDRPVEAKRLIGYLPENPPLYPEMTVRRYLRFVGALKDVPAHKMRAAVDRAIERTRLGEVADKRIAKLSKGFKQRVGLAQALVHEPPVLILDEPTSSLDPKQRTEVRELIAELKGSHTVLLSTHILSEVSEVADRVFIIDRGKVMAVDTPEHLGDRLRAREIVRLEVALPGDVGGSPRDVIQAALVAMPGVSRVQATETSSGTMLVQVETPVGVDLRSAVAEVVVGRRWKLLSLAGESLSLEEIFLALTGDAATKEQG